MARRAQNVKTLPHLIAPYRSPHAPIWSDPTVIVGRRDRVCRVKIHRNVFLTLAVRGPDAPDRVLANSPRGTQTADSRRRRCILCFDVRGCRHALGRNFEFLLAVFALFVIAALLVFFFLATAAAAVATRRSAAVVELALLSSLAFDDVFEEGVSQDVFRRRGVPLFHFWRETRLGVRRG